MLNSRFDACVQLQVALALTNELLDAALNLPQADHQVAAMAARDQ
ncbi:hypothetical protein RZA67_09270 [Stenotrophomonas sp. C3(2023)]|nr:hypothetical protein [Stenotrophomonas sp. C3(2023)]MDV3468917.1 hypothetical protein [Stenotrophomonas sp. C3(2023)]